MLSGRILVEDSTCIIGILDSSLVWGKLAVDPNQAEHYRARHSPGVIVVKKRGGAGSRGIFG